MGEFQNRERLSGWAVLSHKDPQEMEAADCILPGHAVPAGLVDTLGGPGMTIICNQLLVLSHSGPLYRPESVGGTVVSPQKAAGLEARVGPGRHLQRG